MQLCQPILEPHSLCYTCWVQVVYSLLPTLLFFSSWGYSTAAQFLPTRGSSLSATRTTRTSRRSSPSRRPCGALLQLRRALFVFCTSLPLYQTFLVINVINNIRIRFIISFYVICAVIYCSFCCIYVWLNPSTYMIAQFMSFYKPGVTSRDICRSTYKHARTTAWRNGWSFRVSSMAWTRQLRITLMQHQVVPFFHSAYLKRKRW